MPASLTTSLLITDSLCLRLVDPKNLLVGESPFFLLLKFH